MKTVVIVVSVMAMLLGWSVVTSGAKQCTHRICRTEVVEPEGEEKTVFGSNGETKSHTFHVICRATVTCSDADNMGCASSSCNDKSGSSTLWVKIPGTTSKQWTETATTQLGGVTASTTAKPTLKLIGKAQQ